MFAHDLIQNDAEARGMGTQAMVQCLPDELDARIVLD